MDMLVYVSVSFKEEAKLQTETQKKPREAGEKQVRERERSGGKRVFMGLCE